MKWKQLHKFTPSKMGKIKDLCLQNVAKGFGIYPSKNPTMSAKEDMQVNKKKGTLHTTNPPVGISVPVYVDTISPDEHIMVWHGGKYYSDGKIVNKPKKIFGWGEWCDGVQIIKKVEEKKTNLQIAKEVIAGKWGNGITRKAKLKKAGYDYNEIQKLVNKLLK